MKIASSLLLALCLFAQADGFTPTSAMWFSSDGGFNVGMEVQGSDQPIDVVADRIQAISVFPKRISFSGSASLRPRIPNHSWFGGDYEFKEDSLIVLTLEGPSTQSYVLFSAILKANREANTVYVPAHILPDLGAFPTGPLLLHLNVSMSGRGGADTEVQLHGRWE